MVGKIHVGDVGTAFRATITDETTAAAINVSTATSLLMWFQKPDQTTVEFAASFYTDGADGIIQYVTAAPADLDQAGGWKVQGVVAMPGTRVHSDVHKFKVWPNLREDV